MQKQFVPYELAFKLKELGFNEECLAYYNGNEEFIYGLSIKDIAFTKKYHKDAYCASVLAPLWQQAFDWISEEKHIDGWVAGLEGVESTDAWDDKDIWTYEYRNFNLKEEGSAIKDGIPFGEILYHQDARLKLLEKLISLIK